MPAAVKASLAIKEFPKEINVTNVSDYVTYTAYEPGEPVRREGAACYAGHMNRLKELSFKLEPQAKYTSVPNATYLEWIGLCKQAGLIPESVLEYVENEKNYLWIPAKLYDRHTVYITMCCYRWSASCPKMIWQLVEHMKRIPGITFWQALHYALGSWTTGTGHSFSNISKGPYAHGVNLLLSEGLAIKYYCSMPLHDRPKSSDFTYQQMGQIAGTLDPKQTCKMGSLDEILTEKWTPLFQLETLNAESIKATYEKLKA